MQIMAAAGDVALARQALLGMGLLSVALAAVFMVRQPDVKRLLAYSSVEHMGILAIGVGVITSYSIHYTKLYDSTGCSSMSTLDRLTWSSN